MIKNSIQIIADFFKLFYKKGLFSICCSLLFLLGLGYMLAPVPTTIADIPAVPDSKLSTLDGDTWQNTNIVGYFSNYRREDIMNYYWNFMRSWNFFGIPYPILKINHPPERAYTFIRDQQESTALEEYYVPFHGSLFVNVYDPIIYNQIRRRQLDFITSHIDYEGTYYNTKTTLRYYPTSVFARLGVYLLTIFSIYLFVRLIQYYRKDV